MLKTLLDELIGSELPKDSAGECVGQQITVRTLVF